MEINIINSNGGNVVALILKLFHFFYLKIVEIEFKMTLQSFFGLEFFQVSTKLDFPYLSHHLSKWNESKLSIFIKIYIKDNF